MIPCRFPAILGLGLLALAACAPAPEAPQGFRDAQAPIASTTRGRPSDLNGLWQVEAAYPGGPLAPGDSATFQLTAEGDGLLRITGADGAARLIRLEAAGPSRWSGAGRDWWLLWADDGFRTMVLGAPDGLLGAVLNRPGAASPDRSRAARELLDFNGYDLTALRAGPSA
ncbi:lipocalin [Pseudoroseicyclus aestuarii]|uniref:Apolipoprotein D and lipocalin family protein n=1 Tax=Pseudoroseicyclus aestuarii TaxID=1795041 RepID=A0A318SVE4_9RHOB|nr:lipocalin [Pseudoroseicyclus aestuarii]PYE85881.1 apolipoprotein D and lipocalin family protein [Pseudoroseicyclus aestuarii]